MLNGKLLDDIAARVSEVMRSSPAKDVEKNVKALLGQVFSRLDLVTREEFDVQAQLLLRTREKLDRLEAQIAELDAAAGRGGGADAR